MVDMVRFQFFQPFFRESQKKIEESFAVHPLHLFWQGFTIKRFYSDRLSAIFLTPDPQASLSQSRLFDQEEGKTGRFLIAHSFFVM